jgi:8-oxo-dGTP pyrophosphatase MutT (NUDIX family)
LASIHRARAALDEDSALIVLRHGLLTRAEADPFWALPGGHIEPGEMHFSFLGSSSGIEWHKRF